MIDLRRARIKMNEFVLEMAESRTNIIRKPAHELYSEQIFLYDILGVCIWSKFRMFHYKHSYASLLIFSYLPEVKIGPVSGYVRTLSELYEISAFRAKSNKKGSECLSVPNQARFRFPFIIFCVHMTLIFRDIFWATTLYGILSFSNELRTHSNIN